MMTDLEGLTRRSLHNEDDSQCEDSEEELVDKLKSDRFASQSSGAQSPVKTKGLYPSQKELEKISKKLGTKFTPNSSQKIQNESNQKPISKGKSSSQTTAKNEPLPLFYIGIAAAICIAVIIYYTGLIFGGKMPADSSENDVNEIIHRLSAEFKQQTSTCMKVIKASLKPVIPVNSSPIRPAVIALISNKESSHTAERLAQKLADSLKTAGNRSHVYMNGEDYSYLEAGKAKKEIDKKISDHFQKDELNVALVKNLDRIPAGAAMIFHGYCDDKNAQFKKAVYIMTVTTTEAIPHEASLKEMDGILSRHLKEIWSNVLQPNQLWPLLSRLTVSAATVLPE